MPYLRPLRHYPRGAPPSLSWREAYLRGNILAKMPSQTTGNDLPRQWRRAPWGPGGPAPKYFQGCHKILF